MICWTLGITEHHNAVDNVLSLINLGLLCGHVGRWGSGLNPLRGQNNVQGGGDMGAIPNKLPGFQDIEHDPEARARFEAAWGARSSPTYGWHLTADVRGDGARRAEHALRDRREPGAVRGRHQPHARSCSRAWTSWSCRTSSSPRRPSWPTSCSPPRAAWCEAEGTVTNSRAAGAAGAQGARPARARRATTSGSSRELARRLGHDWGEPTAEQVWDELRSLSPDARRHELRAARGAGRHPVAVLRRGRTPARRSCTAGSGSEPLDGPPAPFSVVEHEPPFEALDDDFPLRLTTGRRLDRTTPASSRPLHLAAAPGRVARPLARGRRQLRRRGGRDRAHHLAAAARSRRRCASTRRCGPGSRS